MVLNNAARGLHTKFFLSHKHDFSVTRSMTLMQKENASLFIYTNLSFAIFLTLFFFLLQRWYICVYFPSISHLPSWGTKGQMQDKGN